MASYCECGHVRGEHFDYDPEEEDPQLGLEYPAAGCYGDDGGCECAGFEELSAAEYAALERGYD